MDESGWVSEEDIPRRKRPMISKNNYKCGHPKTPENTYSYSYGRFCKKCHDIQNAKWRAANQDHIKRQGKQYRERIKQDPEKSHLLGDSVKRYRERVKQDPDKLERARRARRSQALIKNYGITLEDYDRMYQNQNGSCGNKGCSKSIPYQGLETHIDHNHVTGQVRELLCNACNNGIGHFDESIEKLQGAIEYLLKHSTS